MMKRVENAFTPKGGINGLKTVLGASFLTLSDKVSALSGKLQPLELPSYVDLSLQHGATGIEVLGIVLTLIGVGHKIWKMVT